MLEELEAVPASALPLAELGAQLRLGTGFGEDGFQDALLEAHLRAALGVIEGRTGKALLGRRFRWQAQGWRGAAVQPLPVAPVTAVVGVTMVTAAGERRAVAAGAVRLQPDRHRPCLAGAQGALPTLPTDGSVEVEFDAGFGPWAAVPADLRQAVLYLAATFYERRHEGGAQEEGLPALVLGLIEGWRTVRLLGGGAV